MPSKNPSKYYAHIYRVRDVNPGLAWKDLLSESKKTYTLGKKGIQVDKDKFRDLYGEGYDKNAGPEVVVASRLREGPLRDRLVQQGACACEQKGGDLADVAKAAVEFLSNLPPPQSPSAKVNAKISQYGEWLVSSVSVCRAPIISLVQKAISFLRKASGQKPDMVYDNLFHLWMIVNLTKDGKQHTLRVERNQVFQIKDDSGDTPKDSECRPALSPPKQLTFNDFLAKPIAKQGPSFYQYSASTNNCQDMVILVLSTNHMLPPTLSRFVKQDVKNILGSGTGIFAKIADKITDVAGSLTHLVGGKRKKRKKQIVVIVRSKK